MRKLILTIIFCLVCSTGWAGEVALKIAPGTEQDGEVLFAASDRRIKEVYADHIAHVKNTPENKYGLRAAGTLLEAKLEATMEYKYERVSETQIRRTNLWTEEVDILGPEPNAEGEYIDVPLYIERRLKHDRHKIFGTPGAEYWYGGGTDKSTTAMDAVWDAIEAKTAHRRQNYTKWPFTDAEKRGFVLLDVGTLDDVSAADLSSVIEVEQKDGSIKRERKYKIDYTTIPGLDVAKERGKDASYDARASLQAISTTGLLQQRVLLSE